MPRAKDSVYAALNMFIILTLIITNNAGSSTINKQYVEPNFFLDDPNFSSMIYFVGTGSTESNRLFPIRDNVYEIISSSTFTTITIKANASGLTSWNLGTIYAEGWSNPMDFGNNSTTVGQFFVIIYGDISIVNTNFLGEFGIKVISPQGDHDISFLYLNRDENRYYYSYDHIVVRIRPQKSDFTDYISETFPVKA